MVVSSTPPPTCVKEVTGDMTPWFYSSTLHKSLVLVPGWKGPEGSLVPKEALRIVSLASLEGPIGGKCCFRMQAAL